MASVPATRDSQVSPNPTAPIDAPNPHHEFQNALERPPNERCREYRYRCAQCVVFGLPVLALEWFGPKLSGSSDEASRWVPILQAILAGWICYVGALGMLVEGLMTFRRGVRADFIVATLSIGAYLYSLVSAIGVFVHGRPFYRPLLFTFVVLALSLWNALQWWRRSRRATNQQL
jgi:hypothetical protein